MVPISLPNGSSNLFLLKAGKVDGTYAYRVQKIKWKRFFERIPGFFVHWARWLSRRFAYVCIDSRTGFTDIGGICTMLMPEKLVLVFTPNQQSLKGVLSLAEEAAEYRIRSRDLRPLLLFPLPSRVDNAESALREEWMFQYQVKFEKLFAKVYDLPDWISLEEYFGDVQIHHKAALAYGEKIAVLQEESWATRMSSDFRRFMVQLIDIEEIWEDDPFSSLSEPFSIGFLYEKQDQDAVKQLTKNLGVLRSRNILHMGRKQSISHR